MLQQSDTIKQSDGKIKPSTKQHLVDWIIEANEKLDCNNTIVKQSFLMTGISDALGGYESHIFCNDEVCQEILREVFGDQHIGFDPSDHQCPSPDPFASDPVGDSDADGLASDTCDTEGEQYNTKVGSIHLIILLQLPNLKI